MEQHSRGFTLIELMIALVVLSAVALGLTTTLISTQKALAVSARSMRAAQLAAEGIEQLRAGQMPEPLAGSGGFERTARVSLWSNHPALHRLEVTVTWNDGVSHTFQLVTLARR